MLKAELVLSDCKYALAKHSSDLQGEDFRLSWLSICTLLRAVGHVLAQVDAESSNELKTIINSEWEKLRSDKSQHIFHDFISTERNRFLKQYEYGVRSQLTRNHQINGKNNPVSVFTDNLKQGRIIKIDEKDYFESFITSGYYKNRNEKDVANEAICFWTSYIDNIKNQLKHY